MRIAAIWLLIGCTSALSAPAIGQVELTEENFGAWRDHLLPSAKDVAWESIPWLASLAEGIVASDQQQKPLLLWMMNGHPLGCT